MKTTVEITDSLLRQARRLAQCEGVPLRAVIERGLHAVVEGSKHRKPFQLRRASVRGEGLQEGFRDAPREKLRDTIYKDRGG